MGSGPDQAAAFSATLNLHLSTFSVDAALSQSYIKGHQPFQRPR